MINVVLSSPIPQDMQKLEPIEFFIPMPQENVLDAFQDQTDLMDANGDNRDADLPTLRITANRLSDVGCLCIIL
ncbi:hypothetical protein SeLEV6574_g08167 [Synchytrium endobioticum]|nr:hypothetical protein SeLEV6574_g08167 [Synchytrium endobioticum]